jgi:putative tryptophan/tyrosine transport system substrate-binding protein
MDLGSPCRYFSAPVRSGSRQSNVAKWPEVAENDVRFDVGYRGVSGLVVLNLSFVESEPIRTSAVIRCHMPHPLPPSRNARVRQYDPSKCGADMRRREFLGVLGGAAIAWPVAARAQQAGKVPTIGYLGGGGPTSQRAWVDAFVQRLRELGWIEGRTVAIEFRWGEGRAERYAEIAAEFVRLKVDVILAGGTEAAIAAKQATSIIPIVFPTAGDPVGSRLVASLARPGGNVTGLSNLGTGLAAKRLELLREVFPGLRRLAVMINTDYSGGVTERDEIDAAARTLGLEIVPLPIRRVEDIAPAFEGLKGRAEAFYTTGDSLVNTHRLRINTFALAARLPTMFPQREYVEAAGLMSYGATFPGLNRRAADFVDKILRGAKPADLPVEQPTKYDLVINLTTAKALGLTIPESFLLRADEVIE